MSSVVLISHLRALDDEAFEEWLCLYFKEVYGLTMLPQRNGRRGQARAGVDLMFCNAAGNIRRFTCVALMGRELIQ